MGYDIPADHHGPLPQRNEHKDTSKLPTQMQFQSLDLQHWLNQMQAGQQQLERMIDATPTGARRNQLTEANIHALLCIDAMGKAIRGEGEG